MQPLLDHFQNYLPFSDDEKAMISERANNRTCIFRYTNIPKLHRISKVIIENKFVELQNRALQNSSSTA